jgi:hypothetical protein
VPTTSRQIDGKAMDDAIGFDPTLSEEERGLWFEAYDAAPSPVDLFGPSAPAPAAFVGVQQHVLRALFDRGLPAAPQGDRQRGLLVHRPPSHT